MKKREEILLMRNRKGSFKKTAHLFPQAILQVILYLALILCLSACGSSKARSKETQAEAAAETAVDAGQEASGQTEAANEEDEPADRNPDQTEKAGRQLIGAFETLDLDGNTVTEDIFSKADVTFVNVWGTFCPPCIGEMPDLELIHQELPDNIQIIGILCDVQSMDVPQYQKALDLVEETGVTYPSLIGNESMAGFLYGVQAVPTSFFVDSKGCMIGSPIVGADPAAYLTRLEELKEEYGKD